MSDSSMLFYPWQGLPWEMMSDDLRQQLIDYYTAHPHEFNPYYDVTHVGSPHTEPALNYPDLYGFTGDTFIGTRTGIAIHKAEQTFKQYWWAILIIVAVIIYFVFFRKKRRRR